MTTNRHITVIFAIFCAIILALSLRGLPGNPTANELNTTTWKEYGPLELSPDRGRYALLYSLAEDHSVIFSLDIARFATPDLGLSPSGNYVSLFAPTLSYILLPGYIIGKFFTLAQVGTFAVIALFAIANAMLIRWMAVYMGVNMAAATIGALVFLFGTPAFAYGVSLYQHHVTVFFILSSIAALMKWQGVKPLLYVWFLCGLSISLDNPNLFMMFPIGMYAFARVIDLHITAEGKISSRFNLLAASTLLIMVIPITFFLWFNWAANESPLQLSGTLKAVKYIDENGRPQNQDYGIEIIDGKVQAQKGKTAIASFRTRNLLEGFVIHSVSPDRGVIWYAPIVLFGFVGFIYLRRTHPQIVNILLIVLSVNILLYSMWGDPWGGWAFGSRYLVPSYAILGIGVGAFLSRWQRNYVILAAFTIVAFYSIWVNTLGAITSSMNPPQIEVAGLEEATNIPQRYSYDRNIDLLKENQSKSYLFQEYFYEEMSAESYHAFITALIYAALIILMAFLAFPQRISEQLRRIIHE